MPALKCSTLDLTGSSIMYSSSRNESTTEKVIWSIKNFNRIPTRPGYSIKSPIIHGHYARKTWGFILYPSSNYDGNYMDAYFEKACLMFDPAIYNYSVSIGGSDGKPLKSFKFESMELKRLSFRLDKCIRRESIEKLLKGSVTVQCEIKEVSRKSYFPTIVADFESLSSDLSALYNCPMYYDLTIRFQGFEFHLHTCVLYARCRFFSHVFGYQSFNEMPKIIQANGISPDVFRQLTYYLYSGKLQDFNFSPELLMYARQLKLESLMQSVYEKVQEYHRNAEIATQNLTVTWNLKEIQFQENDSFVQLFKLECCMTRLAIRMGISEQNDEKCIDVSFKVFLDSLFKPVSLICVITLFFNGKVHAYKKDSCNIYEDEEWHFPPFLKLSDISESNEAYIRSPDICLTAEISLSDGCKAYSNLHTKTRLFTNSPVVIYPERLGSDMRRLLSSIAQSQFNNHDISLKSVDDCYIHAHKAILWARWPAIRDLLKKYDSYTCLPLNITSEAMHMLLDYIYTGFAPSIYYNSADELLKVNAILECPPPILNDCRYVLHKQMK